VLRVEDETGFLLRVQMVGFCDHNESAGSVNSGLVRDISFGQSK
jgi:hypothetical protein